MSTRFSHIHITGASGSGTTTLGHALSKQTNLIHLDTDDIFWKTKYSDMHPLQTRIQQLESVTDETQNWVLSGSITNWGNSVKRLL